MRVYEMITLNKVYKISKSCIGLLYYIYQENKVVSNQKLKNFYPRGCYQGIMV